MRGKRDLLELADHLVVDAFSALVDELRDALAVESNALHLDDTNKEN